MDPENYGLDAAALEQIEVEGAKLTPEAKKRGPRATTLTTAKAAFEADQPIPFLLLGSEQNPHVNDKAWSLWKLYAGTDYDGLSGFHIGGSNTYAKLLKGYRDLLMASAAAGVEPDGATINDTTVEWDAFVAQRDGERKSARDARKAEKQAAKAKAEPRPYEDVPSDKLLADADALDKDVSEKRKTEKRETLDGWRAQSKAMRRELALRTTPEQKAANAVAHKGPEAVKAAAEAAKAHPKPKPKAGDADLIQRTSPKMDAPLAPVEPPKAPKAANPKAEPKAKAPAKPKAAKEPKPVEAKIDVFTSQKAAIAAARKELGSDAVEGSEFKLIGKGKRISWIAIGNSAA